ncbi:MAG TPA: pyridoxal phosphate-dependent aminotransferase [Terriglobia bacterium]|nr:pyridoxal phosphate-dependent aminotransferase [Terriglobia bacterium]
MGEPMHFSESIGRIKVSSTAAVVARADQLKASGASLVDFGAGEPDFPTPENIKRAAAAALEANFTRYTPTGGIGDLKRAIVERHARDLGSNYKPEECVVTVGGKQAIFEAVAAVVNPGDEVILPVPYWTSFLDIIRYADGKPVLLPTREQERFAIWASDVERLITPKTRLMIVNSPSNPTGAVVPNDEMQKLLALAERRGFWLLADECYCHFLYDGRSPFSLGSSHNRENLIVVGSLSKTYAMTGWRAGFALGPKELISNMVKLQSHSTSNVTSFVQRGAVEALSGPQDSVEAMRAEYERRRNRIVAGLRALPGVECTMPGGAFYVYPNVQAYLTPDFDANTLATRLLDEALVAVVPGPAFGTAEHVRISYAASIQQIEEGLARIGTFLAKIGAAHASAHVQA